jgi:hypothetical protein
MELHDMKHFSGLPDFPTAEPQRTSWLRLIWRGQTSFGNVANDSFLERSLRRGNAEEKNPESDS